MGLYQDDFIISRSFIQPPTTLMCLLGWTAIAVAIYRWRHNPTIRAAGFGILFFLSAHLLESTVFALEIYFEHRNYLPAFGIYFMLACVMWRLLQPDLAKLHVLAGGFIVLLPLLFAAVTRLQAQVWASPEATFARAYTYHPGSLRVRQELSWAFLQEGKTAQAREHIQAVAEIDPNQTASMALLEILTMCVNNEVPDSLAKQGIYERINNFSLQISSVFLLDKLAKFYEERDCSGFPIAEMAAYLRQMTHTLSPRQGGLTQYQYHLSLGHIFLNAKYYPSAMLQLQLADELSPRKIDAGLLMLRGLYEMGNKSAAQNLYQQLARRVADDSDSLLYQRVSLQTYFGIIQSMPD
jgi:tetratricopeptide (TPR) repeat protein